MNHRLVKEFLNKGSHNIIVRTIDKSPRSYQAVCITAGCTYGQNGTAWKGPEKSTGSVADEALIEHRNETLKDAGQDLAALGALPTPKRPRGKKAQATAQAVTAPVATAPAEEAESDDTESGPDDESQERAEAEAAQEGEA